MNLSCHILWKIIIAFTLCMPHLGHSQNTAWQLVDSSNTPLPQDSVSAIGFDSSGKAWISSSTYQGTNFTPYLDQTYHLYHSHLTSTDGNTFQSRDHLDATFPGSWIQSIWIDSNDDLWLGANGLSHWDGQNWETQFPTEHGAYSDVVFSITEDQNGDIWMLSYGFLAKVSGTNWTTYTNSNAPFSSSNLRTVTIAPNGDIWLAASDGAYRLSGTTWTHFNTSNSGMSNQNARDCAVDANGVLWLATQGGLIRYDGNTWTTYDNNNSPIPAGAQIEHLEVDQSGKIWIAHSQSTGLLVFDGSNWTAYTSSNSNLGSNFIYGIRAKGNRVYAGSHNGLNIFDGNTWTFLSGRPRQYIDANSQGHVYGETSGGLQYFDGTQWQSILPFEENRFPSAHTIVTDPSGRTWTANYRGLNYHDGQQWTHIDPKNLGCQTNSIRSLATSSQGPVWALSSSNEILRFDNGNWTLFNSSNTPFLATTTLNQVKIASNGDCYFSKVNPSNELIVFNGSTFSSVTHSFGTLSTYDFDFAPNGDLWIATSGGILHKSGSNWTQYSSSNSPWTQAQYLLATSPNGNVWVAGADAGEPLYRWNGVQWGAFSCPLTPQNSFSPLRFHTLEVGPDNTLWLGTTEGAAAFGPHTNLLSQSQSLICGDSLLLTAAPGFVTYSWSTGQTTRSIWATLSTTYYLIVGDNQGAIAMDSITVLLDTACVWPGDANYDGVANNLDLLNIGLAFGSTGTIRSPASTLWQDWPSFPWTANFPSGRNYKHADCNGDGQVGASDPIAILQNYGLTHQKAPQKSQGGNLPLYFLNLPDSSQAGDTVSVIVAVGDSSFAADSLYGLAFSLQYDNDLVDSTWVKVDFSNSWLGNPGQDLITLDTNLADQSRLDVALSRTDQVNRSGMGEICRINIGTHDDIAGKINLAKYLHLELIDFQAVTASASPIPLSHNADSLLLFQIESQRPGATASPYIWEVFPNPSEGILHIRSHFQLNHITLRDLSGRLILEQKQPARVFTWELQDLPKGMYLLEAFPNGRRLSQKIILN